MQETVAPARTTRLQNPAVLQPASFATEDTSLQFAIRSLNGLDTCWWPLKEARSHIRKVTKSDNMTREEGSVFIVKSPTTSLSTATRSRQSTNARKKQLNLKQLWFNCSGKKQLNLKQLWFNCSGTNHKASECRCSSTCRFCNRRNPSSICDKEPQQPKHLLVATGRGSVTYPAVVVSVGRIQCRALLNSGAGSSYASAALLDRLGKQPECKEFKVIEMMMQATNREIEIHNVVIESLSGNFQLETEVKRVNRGVLLNLENPGYKDMVARYDHLKGATMDDTDVKKELPVHLILGTGEYAQIKTEPTPKIGKPGEPIADLMTLGWIIMSPGSEPNLTNMFLTQTSAVDYDALCRLDVLGLQDQPAGDQDVVCEEFKEQLVRNPEGWYETGLRWKGNHPPLPDNQHGSLRRLQNLARKLEKQPSMLEKYDAIIQDQLSEGIVERVHSERQGKVSISHIRPSFGKQQRARRSELSTMRLRELTRKHHPLTIV